MKSWKFNLNVSDYFSFSHTQYVGNIEWKRYMDGLEWIFEYSKVFSFSCDFDRFARNFEFAACPPGFPVISDKLIFLHLCSSISRHWLGIWLINSVAKFSVFPKLKAPLRPLWRRQLVQLACWCHDVHHIGAQSKGNKETDL